MISEGTDEQKISYCIYHHLPCSYQRTDFGNCYHHQSCSNPDKNSSGLSTLLLKQMTNSKVKVTGVVVSLILALAIIIIVIKAALPGSDGGWDFSLFGNLFG